VRPRRITSTTVPFACIPLAARAAAVAGCRSDEGDRARKVPCRVCQGSGCVGGGRILGFVSAFERGLTPGSGAPSGGTLKVLVTIDGQLKFAPPDTRAESKTVPQAAPVASIVVGVETEDEKAVIAANRARLAELYSQPYSTIPDFSDALVASVVRSIPRLGVAMGALALEESGLLPHDAVIAGVSALGLIANWIADHGYDRDAADPAQPPAGLFYEGSVGVLAWLLLDWIHRSMVAAEVDDQELETELDAYYPRWSRTDFEWDITRKGWGPLLDSELPSILRGSHWANSPAMLVAPDQPRRRIHTLIVPTPSASATAVRAVDLSIQLDRRAQRNRARERRGRR
jgi:hypothetical protein